MTPDLKEVRQTGIITRRSFFRGLSVVTLALLNCSPSLNQTTPNQANIETAENITSRDSRTSRPTSPYLTTSNGYDSSYSSQLPPGDDWSYGWQGGLRGAVEYSNGILQDMTPLNNESK